MGLMYVFGRDKPKLVKKCFIRYTRTEGDAKMYQFGNSAAVKKINQFAIDIDFEIARV